MLVRAPTTKPPPYEYEHATTLEGEVDAKSSGIQRHSRLRGVLGPSKLADSDIRSGTCGLGVAVDSLLVASQEEPHSSETTARALVRVLSECAR
jgi:hypothetical protein